MCTHLSTYVLSHSFIAPKDVLLVYWLPGFMRCLIESKAVTSYAWEVRSSPQLRTSLPKLSSTHDDPQRESLNKIDCDQPPAGSCILRWLLFQLFVSKFCSPPLFWCSLIRWFRVSHQFFFFKIRRKEIVASYLNVISDNFDSVRHRHCAGFSLLGDLVI